MNGVTLSRTALDTSSGNSADSRVDLMKSTTLKRPAPKPAPAKKLPVTFQRLFDKWSLPFLFVAIGSLMVWALWRH